MKKRNDIIKIKNKTLIINIFIIILGSIFISLGAFHSNIWFDESYSVAISSHSFIDIWKIAGNDVHPVFYYIMLRIISFIFGNSILVFRIFSIVPVIILSVLGITHIRKDYGEKTGIIFSFLTLFLPIITIYACQIRMYTWIMLFVTITSVYANRIAKNEICIKNYIIFSFFSILSCYTHYYGLMAAGIINLFVLVYLIKERKKKKKELIYFIIQAIIQVIIYIPWIFSFIKQLTAVGGGYWIELKFPDTLFNVFGIHFMGNLSNIFGFCFATVIYIYLGYIIYKCKKENINVKDAKKAIIIYFTIIFIAFIISLKSPILYPRYLMAITGILIFFIANILAKVSSNYTIVHICIIIFVTSLISNIEFINNNYDKSNMAQIKYLKENIKENDIIIYSDIGIGSSFAVNFKENSQYFYNKEKWKVEEAYKAYAPQMQTVEEVAFLNKYSGRIWIIDSLDSNLYNEQFKNNDVFKYISSKKIKTKYPSIFDTKYNGYDYNLILIEK